jgi:hypothetical protein
LETEFKQFAAFVWAAEYAWSGTTDKPFPLGGSPQTGGYLRYDAGMEFARAYRGSRHISTWEVGFNPPFGRQEKNLHANVMMNDKPDGLLLIPTPPDFFPGVPMQNRERITKAAITLGTQALMLRGLGTPPDFPTEVTLPLDRAASTLIFAHSTQIGLEHGTLVATYIVTYANGRTQEIPLRYGREIRALDDAAPSSAMNVSAVETHTAPIPITARALVWDNPRPQTKIKSITLKTVSPLAGTLLFSLTGCEPVSKIRKGNQTP